METLSAAKTAVLVIDLQTALLGSKPPPWDVEGVFERVNDLTRRARLSGVTVFFVQQDGSEEEGLAPGSPCWELHPDLQLDPADRRLRKTTCDAFFETDLERTLRRAGAECLVIAGYATEFCIDSTVRSACSREFKVVVAEDAHTTNDNPVLKADLIRKHHNWAWANCAARTPIVVIPAAHIPFRARD